MAIDSPSLPSGGGGDSTGYTETYYDYNPYYDPIVHPQPQAVSNRGYAPVPQYHILGITSEELGNYWLLMNLDPIQAALESGDFGKAIDNSGFEAKQLVADTIFNRASKIQKANYIGPNNVNINLDVISVIAGVVSYAPTPITTKWFLVYIGELHYENYITNLYLFCILSYLWFIFFRFPKKRL